LRRAGAPITAVDILVDGQIREDLSAISGWPTIPQVFVKGELVGGADIVEELERSGELEQTLVDKLGENYWEARGEKTVSLTEPERFPLSSGRNTLFGLDTAPAGSGSSSAAGDVLRPAAMFLDPTLEMTSMASKLRIRVNGLVHSVSASLDTPLL